MRWFQSLSLFAALVFLAGVATPERVAARGKPVTGAELRAQVPGSTVHVSTPIGSVIPITYHENGTMTGSAGAVSFFLGAARDSGRWRIRGNKLCLTWKVWFSGREDCMRMRSAGNTLYWTADSGRTGTSRVISRRRTVAKAKPKNTAQAKPRKTFKAKPAPTRAKAREARQPAARAVATAPTRALAVPKPRATRARIARAASVSNAADASGSRSRAQSRTQPGPRPLNTAANVETTRVASVARKEIQPPSTAAAAPRRSSRADGARRQRLLRVVNVPGNDVLYMRRAPRSSATAVGSIPPDAVGVRGLGRCAGQWCRVAYGGVEGWSHSAYLKAYAQTGDHLAGTERARRTSYRVVNVANDDRLNVRAAPSQRAPAIGALDPFETGVTKIGACRGAWCPVRFAGRSGWVHSHYLAPETVVGQR